MMSEDDDNTGLAAEYVLGTLDDAERAQAESLIASEDTFAAEVQRWERKLGALAAMVESVPPRPELWDKIKAQLGDATPSAPIRLPEIKTLSALRGEKQTAADGASEVRHWRLATGIAAALAACLALFAAAQLFAPAMLPQALRPAPVEVAAPAEKPAEQPLETAQTPAAPQEQTPQNQTPQEQAPQEPIPQAQTPQAQTSQEQAPQTSAPAEQTAQGLQQAPQQTLQQAPQVAASRSIAVLQKDAALPGFILTLDAASKTFTLRKLGAELQPDKSYELWLMSDRLPTPHSLGVIGNGAVSKVAMLADYDREIIDRATYAVSVEPVGGSPTGTPTGPIVFSGKLIEAEPQ